MLNSQEILKHEDTYQAPDSGLYFQERDDDPLLPGSERQLLISSSRSMTDNTGNNNITSVNREGYINAQWSPKPSHQGYRQPLPSPPEDDLKPSDTFTNFIPTPIGMPTPPPQQYSEKKLSTYSYSDDVSQHLSNNSSQIQERAATEGSPESRPSLVKSSHTVYGNNSVDLRLPENTQHINSALTCPNKPTILGSKSPLDDATSRSPTLLGPTSSARDPLKEPEKAWSAHVSQSLLDSISKEEIHRQEAINEMIYSEEKYRKDLDILSEVVLAPLLKNLISSSSETILVPLLEKNITGSSNKRQNLVREMFDGCKELIKVSTALLSDLLALQRQYENECLPGIGDILIKHVIHFKNSFSQYCLYVAAAKKMIRVEAEKNPDFGEFIACMQKNERMERLEISHFLSAPIARLPRYSMLIDSILKKTKNDIPDYENLPKCVDIVTEATARMNHLVGIANINSLIVFDQGKEQDLQLIDIKRHLYHKGDIESEDGENNSILIFDHMLLITKPQRSTTTNNYALPDADATIEKYEVSEPHVPLPVLSINEDDSTDLLILRHMGGKGGEHTFKCGAQEKKEWIRHIKEAQKEIKKRMGEEVYDLAQQTTFTIDQETINCTVPLVSSGNKQAMAVGTNTGVYFKSYDKPGFSKVLNCDKVLQIATMKEYYILLVLSDTTLKAYPLDYLMDGKSPENLGQEVAQNINYFQVGVCNGKELVVFKKKKNGSSIFTVLQPLYDLSDPKNEVCITYRRFWSTGPSHPWFRVYKRFYVGAPCSHVHFLKSKFVVVSERAFEIIHPEKLYEPVKQISITDLQFKTVDEQTGSIKPLAIYRVDNNRTNKKFLLCYDKFAFYVDNRQHKLFDGQDYEKLKVLCKWIGTAERVVFEYPYIIAFDPGFIEIHHAETGNLVQVIKGNQIRLTYFRTIDKYTEIHGCMAHPQNINDHIFHLKLKSTNSISYLE